MAWDLILWLFVFFAVISLIGMIAYQDETGGRDSSRGKLSNNNLEKLNKGLYKMELLFLVLLIDAKLINLSDLEFDYINPYDSSSRINAVVIPEFFVQGALCAVFLLTCHWFPFLIMAPITYYHANLYRTRRHLIDVTEIFSLLNAEKKYRLVKLAFYVSMFLITIYRLVMAAVIALINDEGVIFESGIY